MYEEIFTLLEFDTFLREKLYMFTVKKTFVYFFSNFFLCAYSIAKEQCGPSNLDIKQIRLVMSEWNFVN